MISCRWTPLSSLIRFILWQEPGLNQSQLHWIVTWWRAGAQLPHYHLYPSIVLLHDTSSGWKERKKLAARLISTVWYNSVQLLFVLHGAKQEPKYRPWCSWLSPRRPWGMQWSNHSEIVRSQQWDQKMQHIYCTCCTEIHRWVGHGAAAYSWLLCLSHTPGESAGTSSSVPQMCRMLTRRKSTAGARRHRRDRQRGESDAMRRNVLNTTLKSWFVCESLDCHLKLFNIYNGYFQSWNGIYFNQT